VTRSIPYKIIHLYDKNLLLVISHPDGHNYFLRFMKQLFHFKKSNGFADRKVTATLGGGLKNLNG
jgi:hypothetical protein